MTVSTGYMIFLPVSWFLGNHIPFCKSTRRTLSPFKPKYIVCLVSFLFCFLFFWKPKRLQDLSEKGGRIWD